jgi:hypothetical protein
MCLSVFQLLVEFKEKSCFLSHVLTNSLKKFSQNNTLVFDEKHAKIPECRK